MTGFVAHEPVKTPVLSLPSVWRSTSPLREAASRYAVTASCGVALAAVSAPFHDTLVPSGQSPWGTSASTSGCSGATTMNVAPKIVSGRVVKTSIASLSPAVVSTGNDTRAPCERPIQLRCKRLTLSGQSTPSRSSASRSAYAVMRIIHCERLRLKTG